MLMKSLPGREQAFWKILATPGHVAEQLLVASLGLCIVGDVWRVWLECGLQGLFPGPGLQLGGWPAR